jgi:protein-disulfide isomerase
MGKKKTGRQTKRLKLQSEREKAKRTGRLMGYTLAVIVAAFVLLIVINAVSGPQAGKPVDEAVFQYEKQPALGSPDAPVKIVEFADFKCPACKYFDQNILPQLKQEFIDNGTVQLFFVNYPVISPDADSRTAAMAGEAVYHQNPEAFWKFYEAVFDQQGDENTHWATSDALAAIAKQANLQIDVDKLKKEIDDNTFAKDVKDDEAIVRKLGVTGTPTLFINGRAVPEKETFNYNAVKAMILKAQGETRQ